MRASWTVRFAIVALLIVVVLAVVEALVVNLFVGPGPLRVGIAGILLDLAIGALLLLYAFVGRLRRPPDVLLSA